MTAARRWTAGLLAFAAVPLASGYTRLTVEGTLGGTPLSWGAAVGELRFYVTDNAVAGLRNADNRTILAPGSDPLGALRGALEAWAAVPGTRLRIGPLETTAGGLDPRDGRNTFVFGDSPAIRALTDGAEAVTVLTFDPDGRLRDADIVFNPDFRPGNNQVPFSTDGALHSIDLQSVATHHVGRALGAGPTAVVGAAMFPLSGLGGRFRRFISSDDAAFLREAYPTPQTAAAVGEIVGTVTAAGQPATGVAVTAIDPVRGTLVQTLSSLADGSYRISLPASPAVDRYLVVAEPLDGPAIPAHFQRVNLSAFRADARPEFFGGNEGRTGVDVVAGRTQRADIPVELGPGALRIERVGVDRAGGSGEPERFGALAVAIPAGQTRDLLLAGPGIDDSIGFDNLRLLGPGLRVVPGSVRVDPLFTHAGGPVVRATVEADPRNERTLATLLVLRHRAADVYTGAVAIEPAPWLSPQGVTHGADFSAGPVAPGGIHSLFGWALGPSPGVANGGFDPATGLLPAALGGVAVTFDGVAAPLFFVSREQINLQVPYEVAGRPQVAVVVRFDGRTSPPVAVPVFGARPGIFALEGGSRAIVVNQDGSLNTRERPAERGSVVVFYATGQGVPRPAPRTGAPAAADPLSRSAPPGIELGSVAVAPDDILFSGLAPGFVGLLQVNLRIPANAPTGDAVPIRIGFDGEWSRPGPALSIR